MKNDIAKILYTEEQLQQRVREMGAEIARDYEGKNPIMVCILKGSVIFYGDICKYVNIPLKMDFMAVSSYGNEAQTSGNVKIKKDLSESVEGRHVLVVEDIIDSGLTLKHLRQLLATRNPASVKVCCLLDKVGAHPAELGGEYSGFPVANELVVGYGLDYAEHYRNLPYIGVLKPEVYAD